MQTTSNRLEPARTTGEAISHLLLFVNEGGHSRPACAYPVDKTRHYLRHIELLYSCYTLLYVRIAKTPRYPIPQKLPGFFKLCKIFYSSISRAHWRHGSATAPIL